MLEADEEQTQVSVNNRACINTFKHSTFLTAQFNVRELIIFDEAPSGTIVGDEFGEDTGFQTNKKLTLSLALTLTLTLTPTLTLTLTQGGADLGRAVHPNHCPARDLRAMGIQQVYPEPYP